MHMPASKLLFQLYHRWVFQNITALNIAQKASGGQAAVEQKYK